MKYYQVISVLCTVHPQLLLLLFVSYCFISSLFCLVKFECVSEVRSVCVFLLVYFMRPVCCIAKAGCVFIVFWCNYQRHWTKLDKEVNLDVKCLYMIFFFNVYFTWCIYPEMFSHRQKWKIFFCRDSSSAILDMIGHNLTKFTPVTSCRIAGWRTSSELNRTVFSLSYFLKCVFIQSYINQYKY